jgi:hypothetical protein
MALVFPVTRLYCKRRGENSETQDKNEHGIPLLFIAFILLGCNGERFHGGIQTRRTPGMEVLATPISVEELQPGWQTRTLPLSTFIFLSKENCEHRFIHPL